MKRIAWHYTTGRYLKEILASGRLRPNAAAVHSGERPVVWFTLRQTFEPTANKVLVRGSRIPDIAGLSLTWDKRLDPHDQPSRENLPFPLYLPSVLETAVRFEGLCRIGVSARAWNLRTLAQWRAESGVPPRLDWALTQAGEREGSDPEANWLVSFDPVPRVMWCAVERLPLTGGQWFPVCPKCGGYLRANPAVIPEPVEEGEAQCER